MGQSQKTTLENFPIDFRGKERALQGSGLNRSLKETKAADTFFYSLPWDLADLSSTYWPFPNHHQSHWASSKLDIPTPTVKSTDFFSYYYLLILSNSTAIYCKMKFKKAYYLLHWV